MNSRCKSCGKPVIWVKTARGNNMPIDAEGVRVVEDDTARSTFFDVNGGTFKARALDDGEHGGTVGYVSHFATCPNASHHRGNRR